MAVWHRFEAPSPAIGNVPNWKQGINLGKRNNQNFVSPIECRNAHRISALGNAAEEESIGTLGTIVEQVEAAGFAAPEIGSSEMSSICTAYCLDFGLFIKL